MPVVVINPNATASMTDAMVQVAQTALPSVRFEGITSHLGPPSIQGPEDGDLATPPLLDLVRQAGRDGADGIIIGCFDDTGLAEAVRLVDCPVIGIGQAAYHYAALRQWRFSVVTTLSVSVPILERNVKDQGLGHLLGRVRASDVPVLALEDDPEAALQPILTEARAAELEDKSDAIILGCAGMVQVVAAVREQTRAKVIDPVACAAQCFAWLNAR